LGLIALASLVWLLAGCQDPQPTVQPVKMETPGPAAESTPKPPENSGHSPPAGSEGNGTNAAAASSANSPPTVVKISFSSEFIVPGESVRAQAEAEDPDQDPVILEYEWRVNGERDSRTEMDEFDTTDLVKGDRITVVVTPFDGQVKGTPVESPILVLQNRPPNILSFPPIAMTGIKYIYQVKAEDPDGDPLTYELQEAPPEMEINPETGLIEWTIPLGAVGSYSPRILVSDGDAKAFQVFSLNVTRSQQ